jgi:hypothetical protein
MDSYDQVINNNNKFAKVYQEFGNGKTNIPEPVFRVLFIDISRGDRKEDTWETTTFCDVATKEEFAWVCRRKTKRRKKKIGVGSTSKEGGLESFVFSKERDFLSFCSSEEEGFERVPPCE